MTTTPVAKKPSERIREIINENLLMFTKNKFSNLEGNIIALQLYLDEQWEEDYGYLLKDRESLQVTNKK